MPEKVKRVPTFIRSTYEMLENHQHQHIVAWSDSDDGFVIKDLKLFSQQVLSQYFKHKKYTSFVRQLNMYGFHKKKNLANLHEFTHQNFRKGALESSNINTLIQALKRKPEKKKKMSKDEQENRKHDGFNDDHIQSEESPSVSIVLKNQEPFEGDAQSDGSEVDHKSVSKENEPSDENKEPEDSERVNEGQEDGSLPFEMILKQNQQLRLVHENIRNTLLELKRIRIENLFGEEETESKKRIVQSLIDQLNRTNSYIG